MTIQPTSRPRARGFAAMDQDKQKEIARRGGRAAQALGTAHRFSPEEARLAGRKGGEVVSGNRQHMASIGRRGGEARHALRKARVLLLKRKEQESHERSLQAPVDAAPGPVPAADEDAAPPG